MNSLYRCKCSVGYRPYGTGKIIAFPERQVSQVSVALKWEANILNVNAQGMQHATEFSSSLLGSTASVTLSDPYMTGASWAVLFDSAAAYTAQNLAAANGIILPVCKEGENPAANNCRRSDTDLEVDDPNISKNFLGSYAHLLIKFYYDVGGTRFGLDTYFRVQGFNITHGKNYPQVQIRGVEPQFATFNQTLNNYQMVENETLEQNLERIFNSFNRKVSFCTPPDADYSKEYIVPVSFRDRAVTGGEIIKKYLKSVKGSYLSLPTKEFANKVSICTRANVNQGCSVFYLGVGLYEGYNISGGVEKDILSANAQGQQFERALGYQFEEFEPTEREYTLEDLFPERRRTKLEKVNKVRFPEQFKESDKKFAETQTVSGYIWKGPGPKVTNTRVAKTNLFGISPNGEKAISLLDGIVLKPLNTVGYVPIKTNYFLSICNAGKCVTRPIHQETANLTTVDVGPGQRVASGEQIGTSTKEKPEFTRFYIPNERGESITLDPELVWKFAQPTEGLTDEEKKRARIGSPQSSSPDSQSTSENYEILVVKTNRTLPSTGDPIWEVRLSRGSQIVEKIDALVGKRDRQNVDRNIANNKSPLPQGVYKVEAAGIARGPFSDPEIGRGFWIPITPQFSTGRSALGFHQDPSWGKSNGESGTAGCVGVKSVEDTEKIVNWINQYKITKVIVEPKPGASSSTATPAQAGCFGQMGNTGRSSGPHLHIQWSGTGGSRARGSLIVLSDVSKYITLNGRRLTESSVTSRHRQEAGGRPGHGGIDIAAGFSEGDPVGLIGGATLKAVVEKNCRQGDSACGGYLGNYITISTPDGDMDIGHLKEGSLNCARPGTTGSASNPAPSSGPSNGVQTAPSPVGVTMDTEFNGIPRALRIVPGRTILSFITKYDRWVEEGRPSSINPGVWIPERFSRWIVSEVDYTWVQGNLRVKIMGVSDWGAALSQKSNFPVPDWEDYLRTENFETTRDYYGYIRSLGELCWKLGNGKTSCEEVCAEAEGVRQFFDRGRTPSAPELPPPSSVSTNFPPAKCQYRGTRYPQDRVNGIINAARQGGINTKAGFAGVVGNAIIESGQSVELNPSADNRTFPRDQFGRGCIGIFQWCPAGGRKQLFYDFANSQGKAWNDFGVQMQWFVRELQGADFNGPATVRSLNSQNDPSQAAFEFNRLFERAPGQKESERQNAAREIFNDLRCEE